MKPPIGKCFHFLVSKTPRIRPTQKTNRGHCCHHPLSSLVCAAFITCRRCRPSWNGSGVASPPSYSPPRLPQQAFCVNSFNAALECLKPLFISVFTSPTLVAACRNLRFSLFGYFEPIFLEAPGADCSQASPVESAEMSLTFASLFQDIDMAAIIAFAQGNLPAVLTAVAVVLASLILLIHRSRTARILDAATSGDVARVRQYLTADASRVHLRDG